MISCNAQTYTHHLNNIQVQSTTNYEGHGVESRGACGADVGNNEDGVVDVMEMLSCSKEDSMVTMAAISLWRQ
jgi:hypothetical protein